MQDTTYPARGVGLVEASLANSQRSCVERSFVQWRVRNTALRRAGKVVMQILIALVPLPLLHLLPKSNH